MKTISLTRYMYYMNLQSSLRNEGVKFQYRVVTQKDGPIPFLFEIRILPGADEDKVNAAMAQHQAWIQEYEHRKGPDGWIDD